MIVLDVWSSVVVLTNQLIDDFRERYPGTVIDFQDWEAGPTIKELPNCDLVGPTAITVSEPGPGFIEASFAIAVCSYGSDLFRHRTMLSLIFERLRPEKQMPLYDAETATVKGYMAFTNGTLLAPMSKAEARPWQYVQVQALLDPTAQV